MLNARRTCKIIDSCSNNHFNAFEIIGNDSKANWVPYELKPKEKPVFTREQRSNGKNGKAFYMESLLVMKSRYTTITRSEKSHGVRPTMH